MSGDEFQSEKVLSTQLQGPLLADDVSYKKVETFSETTRESGHSFDSQETISDNELYSEFYENETPKTLIVMCYIDHLQVFLEI